MRLSSWRTAPLFLLLLLLFASPSISQVWAGRGRVLGTVTDHEKNPIQGARIILLRDGEKGQGPEVILTDEKGKWGYLGLRNGQWTIIVEAEGFIPREGSVKVSEFKSGKDLAVSLDPIPVDAQGLFDGGKSLVQQGKFVEARAEYEAALEGVEGANQAPIFMEIGHSYLMEAKYKDSRKYYEKTLALLKPEDQAPVFRAIAESYNASGDVDKALETLDKSLALTPGDPGTLRAIIAFLVDAGREDEAQVYMDQMPAGETLDPNTLLNMGIKAYNEGEIEKSLGFFDRATNENPNLADVYYYRGLARLNGNDTEGAKADFSKLLELAPDHDRAEEAKQFLEYL